MKGPGGDEDHCTPFRSVELCLGTMVSVEEHVLDVSFFFCAVKSGLLVSWFPGCVVLHWTVLLTASYLPETLLLNGVPLGLFVSHSVIGACCGCHKRVIVVTRLATVLLCSVVAVPISPPSCVRCMVS